MEVSQTVEVPPSRRLVIDVPQEIPEGLVILTFTPAPDSKVNSGYQAAGKAVKMTAELANIPNRKSISQYFGILSPNTYGDGVDYQRNLRDEWDG
jgi:hypothetical protein